jgi:diguanylate cyclase (GGDEF)-like protein
MSKAPNKRYTAAFFSAEIEGDYSSLLCNGALDSAEEHDVNLLLFPGKALNSPYQYQHQYNVIYDLVTSDNVDAVVIPLSIFHNQTPKEEIEKFCRRFFPLPVVTVNVQLEGATSIIIDNRKGLRDLLNHMIHTHGSSKIAFIQGVENNIDAEERFAVYREVLNDNGIGYEPDLVCPGDFTINSVARSLSLLIDERKVTFDTLLAANDEMALAAMSILRKRGVRIPESVAVIGFDNVNGSRLSNPPLTTVRQPIYEMGYESIIRALGLINGEEPDKIVLTTTPIIRKSCGCTGSVLTDASMAGVKNGTNNGSRQSGHNGTQISVKRDIILRSIEAIFENILNPNGDLSEPGDMHHQFISVFERVAFNEEDILAVQSLLTRLRTKYLVQCKGEKQVRDIADLFDEARVLLTEVVQIQNVMVWADHDMLFRQLRGVLYGMFPYVENKQFSVAAAAADPLKVMGLRCCYIYLYNDEILCSKDEPWVTPDEITLAMAYSDEHLKPMYHQGYSVDTRSILTNKHLPKKRRYSLIVNPLFFLDYQMGIIMCDLNLSDRLMYESLFVQMGSILKFSYIVMAKKLFEDKLRNALCELEENNELLNLMKQTDDLTGLYNREGFLTITRQRMQSVLRRKSSGLLFYAVLEGSDIISKKFDSDELDSALRETGLILKKTFRNNDIVSRLTEDVFVIFTDDVLSDFITSIISRMNDLVDQYNGQSDKPYLLSIFIDVIKFPSHENQFMEELLAEVETRLKAESKKRKPNILK